jgi:hypothetical protein
MVSTCKLVPATQHTGSAGFLLSHIVRLLSFVTYHKTEHLVCSKAPCITAIHTAPAHSGAPACAPRDGSSTPAEGRSGVLPAFTLQNYIQHQPTQAHQPAPLEPEVLLLLGPKEWGVIGCRFLELHTPHIDPWASLHHRCQLTLD